MNELLDKNKAAYKLKNIGPIYCINLDGQPERWEYMGDNISIGKLITTNECLLMMAERMT